jgi:NAD(P)-dependent dehydrogenase (short-subunit alcohol dehydrogenase family)
MSETSASISSHIDLFDLTGRRALVTGASRGIGRELALGLAASGADVVAVARSADALQETARRGGGLAGSIATHEADLSDPAAVEATVDAVTSRLGGLDILVNNAAVDHEAPIEETSLEDYQRIMTLNMQSCWLLCRAASSALREGGGKVVNIASIYGLVGMHDDMAYIAAKHGLIGMTRALAVEWGTRNVQVNALAPGFVETEMMAEWLADPESAEFVRSLTPMRRWAQPREMVGPLLFLASRASDFMTGQVLVVDGGYTAR